MFGDSEAMSEHISLIRIGSDNDMSSLRIVYFSDDSSVSDKSLSIKATTTRGHSTRRLVHP